MSYQYRVETDGTHCIVDVGNKPVDNVTVFRLFSEARDALANYYRQRRDEYRALVNETQALRITDVVEGYPSEYSAEY
jgi:hypothetical protein